ncbi:MAG: SCO family protein [Verrucomicrobia bacterium]|nr:SCO family protein [Kiritimatiellia bacterium]MCO6400669.1 SCO family protein [Verrucomicrobiota bacterium]
MKRNSAATFLTPALVILLGGAVFSGWTHGFRAFTNFSAARIAAGPIPRKAPPLIARDQNGDVWDVAAPSEEYRLVQAMYLNCPDACPIAMSKLGKVATILAREEMPANLRIVSISVDHDAPQDLLEMWDAHGAHPAWTMASLTETNLDATLEKLGVWVFRRPDGIINHGLDTYLLDPSGTIIRIYTADDRLEDIVADLRTLTNPKREPSPNARETSS